MTPEPFFVAATHDQAHASFQPFVLTNPAFCGYRWWVNLMHRDSQMDNLLDGTVAGRQDYWGDFANAAEFLAGWDLTSNVVETERSDVVWMKLVQNAGDTALQVFREGVAQVRNINLLRCDDGVWRVWSVGPTALSEIP